MITNILEDELVLEMTEDIEARQHTLLGRLVGWHTKPNTHFVSMSTLHIDLTQVHHSLGTHMQYHEQHKQQDIHLSRN